MKVQERCYGLHEKYGNLYVFGLAFVIVLLLVMASASIFYFAEDDYSFHECLYWSVTTLSTVGYGDVTPKTVTGRNIAMFDMMIGVAIFPTISAVIVSQIFSFARREDDIKNVDLQQQNNLILEKLLMMRRMNVRNTENLNTRLQILETLLQVQEENDNVSKNAGSDVQES